MLNHHPHGSHTSFRRVGTPADLTPVWLEALGYPSYACRLQPRTTLRGAPAMKARTFSMTSSMSRLRAAVLAQAKWGVM